MKRIIGALMLAAPVTAGLIALYGWYIALQAWACIAALIGGLVYVLIGVDLLLERRDE